MRENELRNGGDVDRLVFALAGDAKAFLMSSKGNRGGADCRYDTKNYRDIVASLASISRHPRREGGASA